MSKQGNETLYKWYHFDYLGEFYKKPKEQVPVGERSKPIRQSDNLYPEGEFMDRPTQQAPMRGDRADVKRPQDNLKSEGS